jgi:Ca2+-binding EF-hand superfamily protein
MTLHESDLRKLFHELDEDHSGFLDQKELRKGLRKLGIPATRVIGYG